MAFLRHQKKAWRDQEHAMTLFIHFREDPFLEGFIIKTSLFNYTENFTTKKWKFSDKNTDIFHISAQNTDCGYSLEPPRRGGSN